MNEVGAHRTDPSDATIFAIVVAIALTFSSTTGCTGNAPSRPVPPDPAKLQSLYDAHDFFRLRELLEEAEPAEGEPPAVLFYRAAVHHAFNEPRASAALLDELLASPDLDVDMLHRAHRVRRDNSLRMHDYAAALSASRALLATPCDHDHDDARNTQRLLEALRDVPPQAAEVRGPSVLALDPASEVGLSIPLEIEGLERRYIFDTGANLSVLMRSEAEALGLEIRPANVEVGNSVGGRNSADIAVASRMTVGNIDYRHVVFLVFPDELLSFPDAGLSIPGILGFPVMEAMGEVRFREDALEIPRDAPGHDVRNLAFEQLEPLVRVEYKESTLLCRLDTGANRTEMYEPFFRRFRGEVEAAGELDRVTTAGVGQRLELNAYELPELELRVGTADVGLRAVHVLTEPLSDDPDDNYLDCNLGQDALAGADEYLVNFRSMSFVIAGDG